MQTLLTILEVLAILLAGFLAVCLIGAVTGLVVDGVSAVGVLGAIGVSKLLPLTWRRAIVQETPAVWDKDWRARYLGLMPALTPVVPAQVNEPALGVADCVGLPLLAVYEDQGSALDNMDMTHYLEFEGDVWLYPRHRVMPSFIYPTLQMEWVALRGAALPAATRSALLAAPFVRNPPRLQAVLGAVLVGPLPWVSDQSAVHEIALQFAGHRSGPTDGRTTARSDGWRLAATAKPPAERLAGQPSIAHYDGLWLHVQPLKEPLKEPLIEPSVAQVAA